MMKMFNFLILICFLMIPSVVKAQDKTNDIFYSIKDKKEQKVIENPKILEISKDENDSKHSKIKSIFGFKITF